MQTPTPFKRWLGVSLLMVTLLSGCAHTLAVKVTRFNQWPADAQGASYRFTTTDAQRTLEMQVYQAQVNLALQAQGLRLAAAGETARFTVELAAESTPLQRQWQEPVYRDQWVYAPPWRDAQGRLHAGQWIPDPLGARYVGQRSVTQTVQESRLTVRIRDERAAAGAAPTVFEATAIHEDGQGELVELMPYLVNSVFQDFPGANGQVRRLSFELPRR